MWLHAKLVGDRNQIGLVCLEEAEQRGEQCRIAKALTKLVGPNSGQVEEAVRPTFCPERCGKRSEGKRRRLPRAIIWYPAVHGLE